MVSSSPTEKIDVSALKLTDDLVELGLDDLFVLTLPDGGFDTEFQTPQGEAIVWAYSRLETLVTLLGSGQPYVWITPADLTAADRAVHARILIALDAVHPDGIRYKEPDVREEEPPAVLDEEIVDTSLAWIPTRPVQAGNQRVDVELHCNTPGEPLLLVYTSLDALRASTGPFQAAAAIRADRIGAVAQQAGARGVVFDAELAPALRHTAPVRDWTRRNLFG